MVKLNKKNLPEYLLLSLILVFALVLRLYKIDIPLADHHSWRQADTAAVARNFIKEGFDFFHPRIDNLTPLAAPDQPNKERLFLVEPPFYQTVVAGFYLLFGIQEKLARLVSVFFSLGAIVFLYLLVKQLVNQRVGLLAALLMAILPYSVFYSRVIMPEPMMLFASLGMLYWFLRWLQQEGRGLKSIAVGFGAWFFTSWALTLKTFPLFLALPMFYLVWRYSGRKKKGLAWLKQRRWWLFVFFSLLPLFLWRLWVARFPAGTPPFDWLFNQGGIRFRPAFFRWLLAERVGKLILGYWGLPLLVLGLILKPGEKEGWFFHWWLVAFLAYATVFAAGNITHDYYQVPLIPIAAVFLAKGSDWLLRAPRRQFNRPLCFLLLLICSLLMIGFSWFEVRGFYHLQGGVDLAGRAVDELTPKDALVLTGDSNDATLLYNCNRHGWTGGYASYFPNTPETIEKVRKMGASVYVTTKFEEKSEFGKYMLEHYPVIKRTDQYIIFSL